MMEKLSEIWTTLLEQLMADKKKSAAMGALLAVLLTVVAVQYFSKSAPATTDAASLVVVSEPSPELTRPTTEVVPAAGDSANESFEAPGPRKKAAVYWGGEVGRRVVSVEGMSRRPVRDVFTTPAWAHFPPDISMDAMAVAAGGAQDEAGFWSILTQRMLERQEERRRTVEAIDLQIAELALQSTMTGPSPMAHISGRLVRQGDMIQGFSVVRIEDRRVTLSKSGVTRTLRMP